MLEARSVTRYYGGIPAVLDVNFTVKPGEVRRGQDPFALPRIEILREDNGWRFLWKVLTAA